jgi:diaminopimelate decarboxylase
VTSIGILADWVAGYYGKPGIDYGHDITGLDGVTIVPEPGTYLLAGAGLLVVMWKRRRK